MSGHYPFIGKSNEETLYQIAEYEHHFDHREFEKRSDQVLDLIERLLVKDPKSRISASEAQNHVWFRKVNQKKKGVKLGSGLMSKLKKSKGITTLQRAILNILVKRGNQKTLDQLREELKLID